GTALLARLRKGTYGDLYKQKDVEEEEDELEEGMEADHLSGESEDEEYEVEEEDELQAMMADGKSNFVAAGDNDDEDESSGEEESEGEEIDEDMEDIEDQSDLIAALAGSKVEGRPLRKVPRVEVEYEYEDQAQQKQPMMATRSTSKKGSPSR
ncbi:ribosome biosynthesis protein, variant 2, partial [Perkinsus olseni]